MKTRFVLIAAFALAIGGAARASSDFDEDRCVAPPEIAHFDVRLPNVADRVARGRSLTVVAIGSSSTAGAGATGPERSYPGVLETVLAARLPGLRVNVINKGINGDIDRTMVERFERDVFPFRPDLIIWQVGSNTVLRENDPFAHDGIMRDGVRRLKESGADVLLMDLQYAPRVLREPDHQDMGAILARIAAEEHVGLFRRFEIMRHWVESGQMTFADMLSPDGLHLNNLSYGCVGRLMADAILFGTRNLTARR